MRITTHCRLVILFALTLLSKELQAREHVHLRRTQKYNNSSLTKVADHESAGPNLASVRHLQTDNLPLPEGAFNTSAWNEGVKLFSALRDPVSGEVAVYFDAEEWLLEHLNIGFISGDLPGRVCELAHKEVRGECEHRYLGKMPRRTNGMSLTCKDPGSEYTSIVLRTSQEDSLASNCIYAAYSIEQIITEKKGAVGACLTSMYSKPKMPLEHWVSDNLDVGISGMLIYYTDFQVPLAALGINAIRHEYGKEPFTPFPHPAVSYLKYTPPVGRYYLGQTTAMNECIYRMRNQYEFLSMADADEFLTVMSPEQTLESLLQAVLPVNAHSVLLEAVLYPGNCQSEEVDSVFPSNVTSPRQSAHFLDKLYEPFRGPKSIVRPNLVRVLDVHYAAQMVSPDTFMAQVDRRQLYFKHIAGPAGECQEDSKQVLTDDRDPEAFLQSFLHHKANFGA